MKISYAITVCDEFIEVQRVLSVLLVNKRQKDEVVVLVDLSKNTPTSDTLNYLHELSSEDHIILIEDRFKNHFADWKNLLNKHCTGDYIFQIDADEIPKVSLLNILPELLELNPQVELYLVPRINTVEGLTDKHIQQWKWDVNDKGWVNWPDYQMRIYKNKESINWINKVHEVIEGVANFSQLPKSHLYSLEHPKSIEKQVKQNDYYNTL